MLSAHHPHVICTHVIRMPSTCHLHTSLSCPISCSTMPGVICTSSADTHVIRMSPAHHLQIHTSFAQSSWTHIVFPVPKILVIDVTVVPDLALLKTYCLHIIRGSLRCPYGCQLCFLSQKYKLLMSLWFLMWPCLRHIVCTSSVAVSVVPMDSNCVSCPKNISY